MSTNEIEFEIVEPDEPGGMWTCWIVGLDTPARGRTRDDAIFWAGWWAGRRRLRADVEALVDNGIRAYVVLGRTDQ